MSLWLFCLRTDGSTEMPVIEGGSASPTVTLNEHVAMLPDASVAVEFTVVVPMGNAKPDGGTLFTSVPGQLSPEGTLNATTAVGWPGSVFAAMFAGQVIVGGSVSATVTRKLHDVVELSWRVAVVVTGVATLGKKEPDGGKVARKPQLQ